MLGTENQVTAQGLSDAPLQSQVSAQFKKMRRISAIEGITLILLMFIAVPLKYLAHMPIATMILGSIHGGAFMYYLWVLHKTAKHGKWSLVEVLGMVIAATIPFGVIGIEIFLKKKEQQIITSAGD